MDVARRARAAAAGTAVPTFFRYGYLYQRTSSERPRETAMFKGLLTVFALSIAVAPLSDALAQERRLTIFAAASTKNALDDANAAYTKSTGVKVVTSYAASSALAKQIEQGAPADVFISADLKWMDYLAQKNLIKPDTRVNLLGNNLVLIAPTGSKLDKVAITKPFDIAKLAGDGRIAIADVRAVPAGLYAKAALESLGGWAAAEPKLAMAENVRATLAFVARGETPVGIVYATDARVEPKVKIVGVFPDDSHLPIVYPVAATSATMNAAPLGYIDFLRTGAAKIIFEKYGFSFMNKPVS
jgi:molybdate transport system substrate-binding protein